MAKAAFIELLVIMGALQTTPAISYTSFNFLSIIYALCLQRKHLLHILMINTFAIQVTFYGAYLFIDSTVFNRMNMRIGCTKELFYVGDFLVHWLPTIGFFASIYMYPAFWLSYSQQDAFLYSMFLNMLWAVFTCKNQFNLSHEYVDMSVQQWVNTWRINACAHLACGFILSH